LEVELQATSVELVGAVFGGDDHSVGGARYPLSKKGHSLEYMRKIAHLRPRTRSYAATQR
jgi:asparaginyl-tRNA synthetase